jgi:16S rRNA (guanine527-N7)-methyltransferase
VGRAAEALAALHGLGDGQAGALQRLVTALEAEPDPPTRMRGGLEAVDGHLADALVALELDDVRRARRVADLGAGAGFPGLALAVALPEATVDLVESTHRKAELIRRLLEAAGLHNARAVPARAEAWAAGEGRGAYDVVTARALAALPVLVEYAAPLLAPGGVLVAWKGARDPAEEAAGARAADEAGLRPEEVRRVVPFEGALNRHLHVLRKVRPTPDRLPRRPGMAVRRPLGS